MEKRSGFSIRFDIEFLESLVSSPEKGVFLETRRHHIALHPAQLQDFKGALSDELGKKIARYDKKFSGILLGFKNVKPISTLGHIGSDNMFIHLDTEADFFIFRPTIGMVLNGIITRTSKDHAGCLVCKTFNVSLPKSAAGSEYEEQWLGSKAKPGDEVSFEIVFLDLESRLPYIRGKILSLDSQDHIKTPNQKITFDPDLAEQSQEESPTKERKGKKKKKKSIEELEENYIRYDESQDISLFESSISQTEELTNENYGKVKKKKKRKHSELEVLNDSYALENSLGSIENSYSEKAKKKKRKASEHLDNTIENLVCPVIEEITPSKKKKAKKNSISDDDSFLESFLPSKKQVKIENSLSISDTSTHIDIFSGKKKKQKKDKLKYGELTPSTSFLNETFNDSHIQDNSKNYETKEISLKKKHKKDQLENYEEYTLCSNDMYPEIKEKTPKKEKKDKTEASLSISSTTTPIEISSDKKKKHKKDKLRDSELTPSISFLNETFNDLDLQNHKTEEISPKKKKHKKDKLRETEPTPSISFINETFNDSHSQNYKTEEISPKKKKHKKDQTERYYLGENMNSYEHQKMSFESKKEHKIGKREDIPLKTNSLGKTIESVISQSVLQSKDKESRNNKVTLNTSTLDETIESVILQSILQSENKLNSSSDQKLKERRKSFSSAINAKEDSFNVPSTRKLSVDSVIQNTRKNAKEKTSNFSNVEQTINNVIQRFCKDEFIQSNNTKTNLLPIKQEKHLNSGSESELDLEKERNALIKKAQEIKRIHTKSFSETHRSIDQTGQFQTRIKRETKTPVREIVLEEVSKPAKVSEKVRNNKVKRESKTPIREFSSKDGDSNLESIRNDRVIKREVKTPLRDLGPQKISETPKLPNHKMNKQSMTNEVQPKRPTNNSEMGKKSESGDNSDWAKVAKKSKVNGIIGSASDWEVEDFSERRKVSKKPRITDNTVKEEVFSDAETLKKKAKRKDRNSQSFSLNDGDLNILFTSPSVKVEPKIDERLKKTRRKSLSRSLDLKDIKLEPISDIEDTETFRFSRNRSLDEWGLHTEVDLGIKEVDS